MSDADRVLCVACSAFQPELDWLRAQSQVDWDVLYLDSGLHMYPDRLTATIHQTVADARAAGREVVVLFGDCSGERPADGDAKVHHAPCENCAQAILGPREYRRLVGEHACCLFTEWARRWREVLANIPGLGVELTAEVVRESHHKMVFLDTGIAPVPHAELRACAEHFGLPMEIVSVPLDPLLALLSGVDATTQDAT